MNRYANEIGQELSTGQYLLEQTYQLAKDPKILVAIIHHINDAQLLIQEFVLYLANKKDFRELAHEKNLLTKEEEQVIDEIARLCEVHKKSDVEFSRKQNYVMCEGEYNMSTLDPNQVKKYLLITKTIADKLVR